jgi:hypothetical protein
VDPDYARIIRGIAERPVDYEKPEEAARTDPWRWYCRLCGAEGEAAASEDRDDEAASHLRDTRCGRHGIHRAETAGRLLHVWSYPRSAAARLN